jgi:TPR repeat protein
VKKFLRTFCFFSLAGAAPLSSALADVKAGVDAWSAGNYELAVKEWKPLAAAGDPDALFNLAQAYKLGRGVPEDLRKATELYGKAAAKGHVQASDIYGLLLFQNGRRAEAMPYIEASAARGEPRAQYILGLALFNGDNVERDWVRAYALVSLAHQAGLPQAATALPQMDQHIPLEDRQKSVILATRLAAEARATHDRQLAAAELGNGTIAGTGSRAPEIVSAERAVDEAIRAAGTASPATAGADYTGKTPPPAKAAAKPAAPPTPLSAEKPSPAPAAAASGPWRVQLGAFGVAGNADALWARVKSRPELAGHGKMLVPAGRLTKLQAGGFASKADADATCSRLSAAGFACLPVRD